MKRLTLLIPILIALLCPLFMAARDNDAKKIVFIAGNRSHGSGEHEFNAGCLLLAKALNEQSGLNVKATVLRADWPKKDKAILEGADTIVIYADATSGHAGQWEFLDGLAKKGVGMVFMHYAVHPSPQIGEKYYRPWIGAAMESGWSVNPHWVADLKILQGHEISNGVPEEVTCLDEWYYNMRFIEDREKVLDLFTAVPTRDNMHRYINMWNQHGVDGLGKPQTLMWGYERPNGGRGIGFTGGHYHHTWAVDGVRTAVLNSIVWTAGMKVPEGGVKSKSPTEDELNENLDKKGNMKRVKLPDVEAWKKLPPAPIKKDREAGFKKGAGAKVSPAPAPEEKKTADKFDPDKLDPQMVPVESLAAPDDLEVTVWATTPLLFNPTNMDTDAAGRIWVAEGVNYRRHQNRRAEGDRIVVLEDKDNDGKADSSHTFVQDPELVAPLGVSVFDNKVVVAQPPNLIVYTDVNRDLKFDPAVDKRENLLTGFNGKNHDHSLHAVVAGPDGKWYFNQGNCGANFKSKDGKEFWIGGPYKGGGGEWFVDHQGFAGKQSDDGHVWVGGFAARMNPDGSEVQILGHGFRNSYEHTVTSFGDVFQNDNDDPPACRTTWLMEGGFLGFFSPDGKRSWRADQRPGQTVPEAHWRQWDPGTLPPGDVYGGGSPTGICFYENGALPLKYEGLLASCEAARKVVFGYFPELDGSNFKLERFDFFKATAGNMFRPSDVMVGADGAIYVADWYDPGVGGHNDRDRSCSGTIYRIAPKGFKPQIPEASPDSIEGAVTLLRSPAQNVRFTGFEALRKAGAKALPAVQSLLEHRNRFVQARAVWLLPFLGDEGIKVAEQLLESPKPEVRLLAFRALRNAGRDPLLLVAKLIRDPHPAVRRELAVSLRHAEPLRKASYVSALMSRCSTTDRTYLEACGLAAEGAENRVWTSLRTLAAATDPLRWTGPFAKVTWRLKTPAAIGSLQKRAQSAELTDKARLFAVESVAFIDDPTAAKALIEIAKGKGPVGAEATRWLVHLASTRWKDFDVHALLKEAGLYDPEKVAITMVEVPVFEGTSKLPPVKEILALKGNPEKGKTAAARCVMCHELEGKGVNFGPSLKRWIANQGEELFVRAVVNPSEQIAHGYTGHRVRLEEGGQVDGLVLSHKDPVIVQSQGGLVQLIPAAKVAKVEPLNRSLMLSADQLGLSAQDVADLTAYLTTLK